MDKSKPNRRQPPRRNAYAAAVRRMGQRIKPSNKIYSRKGRSVDRPESVLGPNLFWGPDLPRRRPVRVTAKPLDRRYASDTVSV